MKTAILAGLLMSGTASASSDIINGEAVASTYYPSAGGMLAGTTIDFQGSSFDLKMLMCSATLIAPDVVMIAAHCIDFEYFEQMAGMQFEDVDLVFSREADLSRFSGMPGQSWPSDAAFAWDSATHPGWAMSGLQMGLAENDDIALLFLDEPIFDVEPAVLPTAEEADAIVEGAIVDIVGWGQQTSDQTPPAGTVGIKIAGQSEIVEVSPYEFKVGELQGDVRKCHGDSGGPTYIDLGGSDGTRVIGVTSHAYDMTDCRETGGVDTRVDFYLDWIDAEMRSRCEDGTRSWCETDGIIPPGFSEDALAFDEDDDEISGCSCTSAPTQGALGWWALVCLGVVSVARRKASSPGPRG